MVSSFFCAVPWRSLRCRASPSRRWRRSGNRWVPPRTFALRAVAIDVDNALTVQLIDELEIATMEHLSGLKDELESELDRGVLFGLDVEEPKVQVRCRLDSRP